MDSLVGIASRPCDDGDIQPGDAIPGIADVLQYFLALSVAMQLQWPMSGYIGAHGKDRILVSTKGGLQGDPLRFCRTCGFVSPRTRSGPEFRSTTPEIGVDYIDDSESWSPNC